MKRTIWYMYKDGEERAFAMTRPPERNWVALQAADGYVLVSFELELPNPADIQMGTVAVIGPYNRGIGPAPRVQRHTVESLTETLRHNFVRADGDCICHGCECSYSSHPHDQAVPWLTVLCDGSRVKL